MPRQTAHLGIGIGIAIGIAIGNRNFVSAIQKKTRKPIAISDTDTDSDTDSECGGGQAEKPVIYP
jgi:hypothetical protein